MKLDTAEKELLAGVNPAEIVALLQALIQQRSDYPHGDCQGARAKIPLDAGWLCPCPGIYNPVW